MSSSVVIGLQWGDEGKGKIVDLLSDDVNLAVRCQGGANAGHTVEIGDEKYVLHLVPTGILRPDVRCLIGNGVVVDLSGLFRELSDLYKRGVLTEAEWQTELSYTPYHWNTPFGQLLWSELKGDYDPEFVAAVDNVLAESEGEPNDEWLRRVHERVANLEF